MNAIKISQFKKLFTSRTWIGRLVVFCFLFSSLSTTPALGTTNGLVRACEELLREFVLRSNNTSAEMPVNTLLAELRWAKEHLPDDPDSRLIWNEDEAWAFVGTTPQLRGMQSVSHNDLDTLLEYWEAQKKTNALSVRQEKKQALSLMQELTIPGALFGSTALSTAKAHHREKETRRRQSMVERVTAITFFSSLAFYSSPFFLGISDISTWKVIGTLMIPILFANIAHGYQKGSYEQTYYPEFPYEEFQKDLETNVPRNPQLFQAMSTLKNFMTAPVKDWSEPQLCFLGISTAGDTNVSLLFKRTKSSGVLYASHWISDSPLKKVSDEQSAFSIEEEIDFVLTELKLLPGGFVTTQLKRIAERFSQHSLDPENVGDVKREIETLRKELSSHSIEDMGTRLKRFENELEHYFESSQETRILVFPAG